MEYIGLVIVALMVIVGLIVLVRTLRSRRSSHNIIKFEKEKNNRQTMQKCTYCKKINKITFYASDNGTVVGVCKACKSKVISEDMLPI
ncbi:hypothetical protein [Paenibacillus macquariensis]|uniref:Uncharacterized protein n=1 Tax=Paenibacillus macquariensis TaxID=948756 RepID=A0ABY1JRG3_9BACL|nr:hypothetical protein [Paenibacillus macquariensis]MEC0092750.1 hypothetical protein [Paenibacillus macquariensis]OAB36140.1 hypothetical protein PMSM_06700 [Paenibacillus macquariensis subsp. macquariensis]SIQ65397.1 hypothetical protein SAMN05421578_103196 [Paenibacillus macquariensis]